MDFKVYRSLDKPSVLFGIRGSFIFLTLLLAGGGAVVAVVVGTLTSSLIGTGVFLLGLAAAYGVTLFVQQRMTERQAKRLIASRRMPRMLVVGRTFRLEERSHEDAS